MTLFDECIIEDDGSSNCQALDAALVDLQSGFAAVAGAADKPRSAQYLAEMKVNKAKLAIRSAASKFGPAQKKEANEWLERALKGENEASLVEESLALFGECELSADGTPNKCEQLSKALDRLKEALGEEEQPFVTGKVVPVSQMSDMQYRKYLAGELK